MHDKKPDNENFEKIIAISFININHIKLIKYGTLPFMITLLFYLLLKLILLIYSIIDDIIN